jgi:hypothetical protein|tara:strand:- start:4495 stop:4749 length:255 start_codon:yes stop_codon:yes gene_type:complete
MNEYILKVKNFEGEVLELKTFSYNLMEVIDTMVSLDTIEAIETITRSSDGYTWKMGNSLVPLKKLRKEIGNENLIYNLFKNDKD